MFLARPGMFSIAESKKWEAWSDLKGTTKPEAQKIYIELARNLGAQF